MLQLPFCRFQYSKTLGLKPVRNQRAKLINSGHAPLYRGTSRYLDLKLRQTIVFVNDSTFVLSSILSISVQVHTPAVMTDIS
jgi:hypothetical protein